jgi:hypothetical protein
LEIVFQVEVWAGRLQFYQVSVSFQNESVFGLLFALPETPEEQENQPLLFLDAAYPHLLFHVEISKPKTGQKEQSLEKLNWSLSAPAQLSG